MKKCTLWLSLIMLFLVTTGFNKKPMVTAFGDSNTAGSNWFENQYDPSTKWTNKLSQSYRVINAGIGGNTSTAGLSRFKDDKQQAYTNDIYSYY